MKLTRGWLAARLSVVAALLGGSIGAVSAGQGTPPVPTGSLPASPAAVAATCLGGELYCQLDEAGAHIINSQDFVQIFDAQDATAADDFVIGASPLRSWVVTTVTVEGEHIPQGTTTQTDSVKVRFYVDTGHHRPDILLSQQNASIAPATLASGDFVLTLSTPVALAAGGHYWVSVQAAKPNGEPPPQWMWVERTVQANDPAVWRNPGDGFFTGCTNWTTLSTCYQDVGWDLLFSLGGATSNITGTTPVLNHMLPPGGYNEAITLALGGYNFLPNAVISWTVGAGPAMTIPTTYNSPTSLSASVPPSLIDDLGTQAAVVVVNPGPCYGTCASGPLTFVVNNFNYVYLPLLRR
jgi:hypothetical protein